MNKSTFIVYSGEEQLLYKYDCDKQWSSAERNTF